MDLEGNVHTEIYIHLVIAVRNRNSLIQPEWEATLYEKINAILTDSKQIPISINGMPDHVHILYEQHPDFLIQDVIDDIRDKSAAYLNLTYHPEKSFAWDENSAAYGVEKASIDRETAYIENQKEFHKSHSFKDEFIDLLKKLEIDYEPQELYKWLEVMDPAVN
jgi:putative transposase